MHRRVLFAYCEPEPFFNRLKAKKRQSIDARLQAKLAKEQSLIRKQDEAKKDRLAATRKEEDLSVKDGIVGYFCLPSLSNNFFSH
jgi:hypothetical protein